MEYLQYFLPLLNLEVILWIFGLAYVTQTYYLAIMTLSRARDEGTLKPGTLQSVYFALWLVPGLICDWLLNMTVGTVIFAELPKEAKELLTARLKRHVNEETFRGKIARFVCKKLLDRFDPRGRHC